MVLEATRILDAKLVRDVRDVDLGLIFGLGFPAFRGGLLFWADTLGATKIVEMLKPFADLGVRMQPHADAPGNGQEWRHVLSASQGAARMMGPSRDNDFNAAKRGQSE